MKGTGTSRTHLMKKMDALIERKIEVELERFHLRIGLQTEERKTGRQVPQTELERRAKSE